MNAKNYHDVHLSLPMEASNRFRDFEGLYSKAEVLARCQMGTQFVWDILEIEDAQVKAMVQDMTINLVNEHLNTSDEITENEAFIIAHTVHEMLTVRWWMKTDVR